MTSSKSHTTKSKRSGKRNRPIEEDRGGTTALKPGIFAKSILTEGEMRNFDAVAAKLRTDFALNDSSDFLAVEAIGIAFIQFTRAMEADNAQAAETFDRMVRCHLKDLKVTKISREGEAADVKTTPAEWATALREKLHKGELKPKGKGKSKRDKARETSQT